MPPPIPTAILDSLGSWLALVAFGAFHGVNPGMGWLFALALGLQQRSERAVVVALLPITLGHAASVALVAALLLAAGVFIPAALLRLLTAVVLSAFGLYKLFTYYRHPRWVGMRVNMRELFGWSFLMATAHGAGLMVAPLLLGASQDLAFAGDETLHLEHPLPPVEGGPAALVVWGFGIGAHTVAMFLTMALVAWIVYRKLGLGVLRRSWVNFDLIWAVALLAVGGLALFAAL